MARAVTLLEQAQAIHLTQSESNRFIELLENPPELNESLKRLFKTYSNDSAKKE